MPPFDDKNPRYSSDSDTSNDSGIPDWFMNNYRDQDAAQHTDVPYMPTDITGGNKWIQPVNGCAMSPLSCVPSRRSPGAWRMVDFAKYGYPDVIQGWKIHVGCHPEDFIDFFVMMSRYLVRNDVAHKFLTFDSVNMPCGKEAGHDNGEGKSCVIYPSDPRALRLIVLSVEAIIRQENAAAIANCVRRGLPIKPKVRPFPGGVKGDLNVGTTGFVAVRYGAFSGRLATKKHPGGKGMLFDPFAKVEIPDPRNFRPYPEFAANLPHSVRAIVR